MKSPWSNSARYASRQNAVVQRRAGPNQLEPDRPVHRPKRDIHRAGPVDGRADRVGFRRSRAARAAISTRESVRRRSAGSLAEQRPVLAPRQLPRQLDVGHARPHPIEIPLLPAARRAGNAARRTRDQVPVDRLIAVVRSDDRDRRACTVRCRADRIRGAARARARVDCRPRERRIAIARSRSRHASLMLDVQAPRWPTAPLEPRVGGDARHPRARPIQQSGDARPAAGAGAGPARRAEPMQVTRAL